MAIAITGASRLQDLTDVNVTPVVGEDEKVLVYDHDVQRFVLKAAAAGVTDHGLLDAASLLDDDHTQYLLATGGRTGASAAAQAFTSGVSIGPSTKTITFNNTNVASALLGSIDFKNNANVVARIAADETSVDGGSYGGYDDADLVFSTATNGALSEKFRIPRTGYIRFAAKVEFKSTNSWIDETTGGALQIGARIEVSLYSALYSRNYARFHRDASAYIAPYRSSTNTVFDMLDLRSNTSDVPAAGFGVALALELQSSTTENQSAARIAAIWNDATHATRKADLVLSAYDTAEREGLRIRANGSAAAIGFLGATPAARVAHVPDAKTDYGAGDLDTEGEVITAINTLNGTINTILATLETFGFHAAA